MVKLKPNTGKFTINFEHTHITLNTQKKLWTQTKKTLNTHINLNPTLKYWCESLNISSLR